MTENLIATTTVDAPAATVFTLLADPSTHADIDGTGWVRESLDGRTLAEVGQIFRMAMYHENAPAAGHYEMANKVVTLEPDRTIEWEPGMAQDGALQFGGWTWRYDLEPVGAQQTRVTLTYDWSGVPAELREEIGFPPFPPAHLDNSLANLAKLAVATART